MNATTSRIAADIAALAAIERPSASPGEEVAARWVASRFQELGLRSEIEPFRFNPDYWDAWGAHGLLAAGAAGLALLSRRTALAGAVAGAIASASFWGDLSAQYYVLRGLLPARSSWNVLARLPNPGASRVLMISAHHDAPHSGIVFHPALFRAAAERLGATEETPSPLQLPFAAMLAVTAGAAARALGVSGRLARPLLVSGGLLSLVFTALMRDIGRAPLSPGANDDASGVAVVLALAEALAREPPAGLEVWFLSTGSEEGILGGMRAFLDRHEGELQRRRPFVLNLEVLGSGHVTYLEGEGFLQRFPYRREALDLAAEVAAEPAFEDVRSLGTAPFATDALVATQRGIAAITVASLNEHGYVPHYHWPTDTADTVDLHSVEDAFAFCHRLVRRLDERSRA